jgi:hypothetical protein
MTISIIIKDDEKKQEETITVDSENCKDWEEVSYQVGCRVSRKVATLLLTDIEEGLNQKRPKGWKIKGFYERTRVTRFGDVTVSRRLYKDDKDDSHFLLDEDLDWPPFRMATPSLTEALVELSTQCSFWRVSQTLEKLTAGVLTKSTIHSLLQEVSRAFMEEEKGAWESCFGEGRLPPGGDRKVSTLFVEADGIQVHLQRENQERYELKSAIAYEGWELLPQTDERYRLVSKKIYCQGDNNIPFFEGASLLWDRYWDMSCLELIVLGGDDADWISKGEEELPCCIRQLDGFHLSRSCRRGWEKGEDMYDAIRTGRVRWTLGDAVAREGKTAQKERNHVLKCLDTGVDWRKKVEGTLASLIVPQLVRGLGAMESNEDKLFANRMKKKGLSWTIPGAQRMGKAIQIVANDELRNWCGRKPSKSDASEVNLSFDVFVYPPEYENSVSVPALVGPHSSRSWVKVLRSLSTQPYPVN